MTRLDLWWLAIFMLAGPIALLCAAVSK